MRQLVAEILAAWRHAERLAHELPRGNADRERALVASEQLQAIYLDLTRTDISAFPDERDGLLESRIGAAPAPGIADG